MTPQTLAKVYRSAHNAMRNIDGLQPQEAFDELLKYLLFLHCSEDNGETIALKRTLNLNGGFSYEDGAASKAIRARFREYLSTFSISAQEAWNGAELQLSDKALLAVHELFLGVRISEAQVDVRSTALRMFLTPELRRGLGIYLTPDDVVRAIVQAVNPKRGSVVLDPACGSGTFLMEVDRHWREGDCSSGGRLLGLDINSRMALLADLNLGHHKHLEFGCGIGDSLSSQFGPAYNSIDYIFTNPPFGVYVDPHTMVGSDLRTLQLPGNRLQSEVLFLERCVRWLKPGAQMAIVLPKSVMTNRSLHDARRIIDELAQLEAVVNLPPETFAATGTQTNACVLFLRKRTPGAVSKAPTKVLLAEVANVGFDSTGRAREGNELPTLGANLAMALRTQTPQDAIRAITVPNHASFSAFTDAAIPNTGQEGLTLLEELVELAGTGRTPPRKAYTDSGTFLVKVGNLTGHGIDWTPRQRNYVTPSAVSERMKLEPGDILMTSSAHNPIYIAKKVDVVEAIPEFVGKEVSFVGEVLRVRARRDRIAPHALLAILRHPSTKERIRQLIRGQTAHLRPKDLLQLEVDELIATPELVQNLERESELARQLNELKEEQRNLLGITGSDD